jgi:UDP-N-acetylglucosamine 2-epimerase (non-hydrolysing)
MSSCPDIYRDQDLFKINKNFLMKKVMLVFGTRPEAIKMAPLVKEFQKNTEQFETIVCVTAQHREMLDQVLDLFEIKPDFDLNLMKQGQDLYDVTSRVLLGMRDVLTDVKPDLVLVHGDTTTSTASALAAFYQQIPVGHVEAGLRTHNLYSPWPEEANRQMTGRLATYHFSPTETSKQNLLAEGIKEENIFVTGNTVIDALYMVLDQIKNRTDLKEQVESKLLASGLKREVVEHYMLKEMASANNDSLVVDNQQPTTDNRRLVLITGHRRENFGDGFLNICNAIKQLAETYPDVDFVYPMHLNPNVRKPIEQVFGSIGEIGGNSCNSNIHFIEPLEYLPFVYLMSQSHLVLTDSGGIQEEAPGLGKPVLVMRDTTERPEAVVAGTVKLVGTDRDTIINEVASLLNDEMYYNSMAKANNPYGDGKACCRILSDIISG